MIPTASLLFRVQAKAYRAYVSKEEKDLLAVPGSKEGGTAWVLIFKKR
jgi:hypothetical protein